MNCDKFQLDVSASPRLTCVAVSTFALSSFKYGIPTSPLPHVAPCVEPVGCEPHALTSNVMVTKSNVLSHRTIDRVAVDANSEACECGDQYGCHIGTFY